MAVKCDLHVGICGAGIGGLAAAIAIAKNGVKVTVLESALELGEIGAGIQMTPNVARFLIKYGVDKLIGENLVEFEELNMRRRDGTKVGYTRMIPDVRQNMGVPWWLVHRMHLHSGLAEVAKNSGAEIIIDARVDKIDWTSSQMVKVTTTNGKTWSFDLLVGADGVRSIVRKHLFPDVKPTPPTGNCAFRAIVPYEQIKKDPIAKELVEKMTMEVWMSERAYVISYPISAGKDFNMVLSHHVDRLVDDVEEIDMDEFRGLYKEFDPRIKRIIDMVPTAKRWPLLVTGPLESWSSEQKNIVLMGDAAHSMVNHMAQGAATSMEDGEFLAQTLRAVVQGKVTLSEAIGIYEKGRMPKAYLKQQVSFLNGAIWHLPDGLLQEARDKAMSVDLTGRPFVRSPNLYGDPQTTMNVYGYNAEADADLHIQAHLEKKEPRDEKTGVTNRELENFIGWWWPKEKHPLIPNCISDDKESEHKGAPDIQDGGKQGAVWSPGRDPSDLANLDTARGSLSVMSLPSDSKQDKVDQENLRQFVINETGVEDPCPTFIDSFLASLQDREQVKNRDDATDVSERYRIALNTVAAQYPKPDYTVESLAGLDPNDPLAKQIVQALMGIEDASPGLVQDIMREAGLPIGRSGAPSPEPSDCKIYAEDYSYICPCEMDDTSIDHCPHIEGDVMVSAHEPGVNDLGAGGLQRHNRDRSSVSPIVVVPISPQDRVACKAEWDSLAMFQPNGLVSLQMLKDEGLFSETLLDRLPPGFHTTVTGLARAMEDVETVGGVGEDVVVYALRVRGGRPGGHAGAVVYAEELVPYVKEGEVDYDVEFWEGIEEMRRENSRTGIVDLLAWAAV